MQQESRERILLKIPRRSGLYLGWSQQQTMWLLSAATTNILPRAVQSHREGHAFPGLGTCLVLAPG